MSEHDDDLQEEIESHLRMAVEERMQSGETREKAEQAVRREFGNVTQIKEVTREFRTGAWFEQLWQDLRYGARGLLRTPAFTVVAVMTLALAIGANSAVFTLVNGVLLRPLPFHQPNDLFVASFLPETRAFVTHGGLEDRLFLTYRTKAQSFQKTAAYQRTSITLTGDGDATRIVAARVSPAFFDLLGVPPAVGRAFTADEERAGRDRVVILSDDLWRLRYAADGGIVGKSVAVDGVPHTVVGVAAPEFSFPASAELWLPLVVTLDARNSSILTVLGRLRPSVTPLQAAAELEAVAKSMPRNPRDTRNDPSTAKILPLQETVTRGIRKSLLIFAGAVGFVLLIACANVANLLLIRASSRRREMAIRVALGASRVRIATQLLAESILIALAGGAAGVLVAFAGVRALIALAPDGRIPRLAEVSIDLWVLLCTMTVALLTGLAFGVVPAFVGSRREPHETLANGVRTVVGTQGKLRRALVSAEIAFALILLTGAGLLVKSFARMRSVDTGYRTERVHTLIVDLPNLSYPNPERIYSFHSAMLEQLVGLTGTAAVGAVSSRPMLDIGIDGNFVVEGSTPFPKGLNVDKPTVSTGYFSAMGIRILAGRDFSDRDNSNAPGVAVVSESVARAVWPGQNALGKRISVRDEPTADDWLTVVGVVNDVMPSADFTFRPTLYLPYLQVRSLFSSTT